MKTDCLLMVCKPICPLFLSLTYHLHVQLCHTCSVEVHLHFCADQKQE